MARQPNIVFTIADDQRFDLVGALGRSQVRTPALDRLAERGTWFTRAHTFGSTHGAVCAPSRAMLHTGWTMYRIPHEMKGAWGAWSPAPPDTPQEEVPLLGEQLRRAGYHCHGVGKWHNGKAAFARSFDSGGRIFFRGMSSHFDLPLFDHDPTGRYPEERQYTHREHSTEAFVSAATEFVRGRSRDDGPFFLYCAFTAPHDPRETLSEWHAKYPPDSIELPPNFLPEHPFDNGELRIRDELLAEFPRTAPEVRRHIADYYAMTEHMDDAIGRLHAAVDGAGLGDDTIFVHSADHGLAVGQHGLMGKQNLYDHSVRVPLLVAGPGFEAGTRDDRLCYLHDLFPTLLQSAGCDVPSSCEFDSLHDPPRRSSLFAAYRDIQRMVRDARHKLIEYQVDGTRTTQLFDLEADPWEQADLAAESDRQADVLRLRGELARWQEAVDDPVAW